MAAFQKKYNPDRSTAWNYGGSNWKLSRSKIELFTECPRCFYLDNKLGTGRPKGPAFTLNIAVDVLLKKEFDFHRAEQSQHPLQKAYGIDAVPFNHPSIESWRDNFTGITFRHEPTNLFVTGAVDDVWQTPQGELIVVDYKATSKNGKIETLDDSSWQASYKRQMGVYQWLLKKNGFVVSPIGYFVYANASSDKAAFDAHLEFEITLVPCEGNTDWIDDILFEIKSCLESSDLPETGSRCEYCPYRESAGKKLQSVQKIAKQKPATISLSGI